MSRAAWEEEGFSRDVQFAASYDYRDDPADQRGAHGCEIWLVLRGPRGAITCRLMTGWMSRPLAGPYMPGAGEQQRRAGPSVDLDGGHYPTGGYLALHAPEQRSENWSAPGVDAKPCEFIGVPCYSDGSYLAADRILEALIAEGDVGAWREMHATYVDWLLAADNDGAVHP